MKVYVAHFLHMRHMIRDIFCPKIQSLGIETLNPFYNSDGSIRVDRPEVKLIDDGKMEEYGITSSKLSENIVNRDLENIRSCDGLVAYIQEASIGCAMEIFYCAKWCRKPVFILTSERYSKHPWLIYLSTISNGCIVTNEKALFKRLVKWKKENEHK